MSRMGFVIDLKRCIGCDTCAVGCKMENDVPPERFRLNVLDPHRDPQLERPLGVYPALSQFWLPTMCQHCSDAPCVAACPTRALWRDDDDGMVSLDKDRCVGCHRCEEACPYDALSFADETTGTADKCSFCDHRLAEGQAPMCQTVCPTRAITSGDLDDPASAAAQLVATRETWVLGESTGARPNIFYLKP